MGRARAAGTDRNALDEKDGAATTARSLNPLIGPRNIRTDDSVKSIAGITSLEHAGATEITHESRFWLISRKICFLIRRECNHISSLSQRIFSYMLYDHGVHE